MNTDLRRSKRVNDFIAVAVSVQKKGIDTCKRGPFTGRVINISHHGVCLLMSHGSFESYEMHHSTSKNTNLCLTIEDSFSEDHFSLSGRPVWTSPFTVDDLRGVKMGIELDSPSIVNQAEETTQLTRPFLKTVE